jgi:hypothetical protein
MIYTVPALNAVDFNLSEYSAPSLAKDETALQSYTLPALNAVDFALVSYTEPTSGELRGRVDYELGNVAQQLISTGLVNSSSFGTGVISQPVVLYPSGYVNSSLFGGGVVSLASEPEVVPEEPMRGGVGFRKIGLSERKRFVEHTFSKGFKNSSQFGNAKIAHTVMVNGIDNINNFGATNTGVSYERMDEEILLLLAA